MGKGVTNFVYISFSALDSSTLVIRVSLSLLPQSKEGTFRRGDLLPAFKGTSEVQRALFAAAASQNSKSLSCHSGVFGP